MPKPEIEEFAKILVQRVRDAAIRSSDRRLNGPSANPVAKRWRDAVSDSNLEKAAGTIIPDVVDDTIFYFLQTIDQELLRLAYIADNGSSVDLVVEGNGELAGWYMGSDGWRRSYSEERFFDDFSDLK